MPATIASDLDRRDTNALNFLRLVFATAVIVYHSTPIGGFTLDFRLGTYGLGGIAVAGFFAISGYLITRSRLRSDGRKYTIRRAARILPGYAAVLIVTAFGFAVVAGLIEDGATWSLKDATKYVITNMGFFHTSHLIGTTLSTVPFAEWWNGSLWTLRWELLCYVLIGVGLSIPLFRRTKWWAPASLILLTLAGFYARSADVPDLAREFLILTPVFVAGAVLFVYEEHIPIHWSLALGSAVVFVGLCFADFGEVFGALPLAYLCLWAGAVLPGAFQRINATNDISYGMYLYGFPVAQLLVILGVNDWGHTAFIVASILATVPFALASWFLVERPAMALAKGWSKFREREVAPARVVLDAWTDRT